MGMVMGAVAAPCVGPVLASLIAFIADMAATASLGRAMAVGAAAFFVTGLGLASPYVVLGLFTGLINRFPRGGGWLLWTKRLMAMGLAVLILFYVQQYIDMEFYRLLVLTTFGFAAVYLGLLEGLERRPFTRRFLLVRLATGAALLVVGLYAYASMGGAAAAGPEAGAGARAGGGIAWQTWEPGALQRAKDAGRPVLLDFTADWCVACKEWNAGLFSDPAVVRASVGLAAVEVDVTRLDAGPKKDFALRFGGHNPPLVVLIGRDGNVVGQWRAMPAVAEFVATMETAAGSDG
jgi:thioredoxin:protein disulfide reductase